MTEAQTTQLVSLASLLIYLGILWGGAFWATRPGEERDVEQWGTRPGVALDGTDVPIVRRYLVRSRSWRRKGLVITIGVAVILGIIEIVAELLRPTTSESPGGLYTWVPAPLVWLQVREWVTSPLVWALAYVVGAV